MQIIHIYDYGQRSVHWIEVLMQIPRMTVSAEPPPPTTTTLTPPGPPPLYIT